MDGLLLFLFIMVAIAIGKSSQKKKPASPAPKGEAPVTTIRPVSKAAPIKPTVTPSVSSRPASAEKQEAHAPHVHTKHVVAPSFYTGHAHEESSMTGSGLTCTPVEVRKAPEKAPDASSKKLELEFDSDSVLKGLLYAEILGKPKALR